MTIQELGIPGPVLMENAARGAARVFLEHFDPPEGARIAILCGRGNNGGDGYVMARYLHGAMMRVSVIVLSEFDRISGDALLNLEIIRKMALEILEVPGPPQWAGCKERLEQCDYLIDGILGTGLKSNVSGYYRQVIEEVNDLRKPVMAIDIPSGLNADDGRIMGAAVSAFVTATFGFPKVGQLVFPGAELVGRLVRIDIGIPEAISDRMARKYRLTEPEDFRHLLYAESGDIHKGSRGHLFILAGSTGKTGAATLAALGALRTGAGLVTVGIPASLNSILENKLTEAMTLPLPETDEGTLSLGAEEKIREFLKTKTALAIGPGLSTHPETVSLVRRIVASSPVPTVVDADGLNAIAGDPEIISKAQGKIILTPHPGEMARLAGIGNQEVQDDRIGTAEAFAAKHGCCLVLKGARTVIAEPQGEIWLNPTGNPALASGGTGDVLTGIIAGLLARNWPIVRAAAGGVYLHGLAADLLAEELGRAGVLAGDLPEVVPEVMTAIGKGEWPLRELAPHIDFYYPL